MPVEKQNVQLAGSFRCGELIRGADPLRFADPAGGAHFSRLQSASARSSSSPHAWAPAGEHVLLAGDREFSGSGGEFYEMLAEGGRAERL